MGHLPERPARQCPAQAGGQQACGGGELLKLDESRKRYTAMMSGLDIRYDLGPGHPLLGRRMPDLDVDTASGPESPPTIVRLAGVERKFGAGPNVV